jgi:hypothetical protein
VIALLGKDADKLETVQESHAMPDYGTQGLELRYFGDGEFQRDHFSGAELAGYDCPQPVFGDLEAPAVNPQISVLPQDLDDQG